MPVAILEDVVTTGGSALKAIARVREHGLKVAHHPRPGRSRGGRARGAGEGGAARHAVPPAATSYEWAPVTASGGGAGCCCVAAAARRPAAARRSRCASTSPRRRATTSPTTTTRVYERWTRHDFVDARGRQGAGGLGDLQELGLSRGLHRAVRVDLQPVRTPSATSCGRRSRRHCTAPTSSTSPPRAPTTSGTISRSRARPGGVTLLDALGHELRPSRSRSRSSPTPTSASSSRPRRRSPRPIASASRPPPRPISSVSNQVQSSCGSPAPWGASSCPGGPEPESERGSERTIARIAPSKTSFSIGFST